MAWVDHSLLAIAKSLFAFHIEDPIDLGAGTLLDQLIGILEGVIQYRGQLTANGRLAGRHHAHQEDAGAAGRRT